MRAKKAAAAPGTPKAQIQEQIDKVSGEVTANRADEKEKRKALKSAVAKQRGQIKSTAEAKEAEIGEAAEETVKKIDNHWNKQFLAKKEALNKTRESRLGYLEQKLEQGRADIAAMPLPRSSPGRRRRRPGPGTRGLGLDDDAVGGQLELDPVGAFELDQAKDAGQRMPLEPRDRDPDFLQESTSITPRGSQRATSTS